MWEAFASLFKEAKDRLNSPLYGVFILSFVVWNWDILVTLFLTDNDSILTLTNNHYVKAGYIRDVLIWNHDAAARLFGEKNVNIGYVLFSFLRLFVPILLSYFFITQLPWLTNWAYAQDRKFLNARRLRQIISEEDFQQARLGLLQTRESTLNDALAKARRIEAQMNELETSPAVDAEKAMQKEWESEIESLMSRHPKIAIELQNLIYSRDGSVQGFHGRETSVEVERILNSNGFVRAVRGQN